MATVVVTLSIAALVMLSFAGSVLDVATAWRRWKDARATKRPMS